MGSDFTIGYVPWEEAICISSSGLLPVRRAEGGSRIFRDPVRHEGHRSRHIQRLPALRSIQKATSHRDEHVTKRAAHIGNKRRVS